MSTYKVGDKVKRVTVSDYPASHGYKGKTYTVLKVTSHNNIVVIGNWTCSPKNFELVEAAPNYEVGKAYFWEGGVCPLPKGTAVSFRYGTKDMSTIDKTWENTDDAQCLSWEHKFSNANIVMFKVVSYPVPKPVKRDVTLKLTDEQLELIKTLLKENEA